MGSVGMVTELELRALTAKIIAAYLSKNPVDAPLDLNDLKTSVYDALAGCVGAAPRAVAHRARGKSTFRQRDVGAAIRASQKAGKEVSSVAIDGDGTIRVDLRKGPAPDSREANEWDAVFK